MNNSNTEQIDTNKDAERVNGRYIDKAGCTPTAERFEILKSKLFQFKAKENFGTIFELQGDYKSELKKILNKEIEEIKRHKTENEIEKNLKQKAIENVENLDIYQIVSGENGILARTKIGSYKEL